MYKVVQFTCTPIAHHVNGAKRYEGRVEVYYNGEWGTVCDNEWDFNDAQVVFRQLGYGPPIAARGEAYYGQGNGQIWLDNLNCTGNDFRTSYSYIVNYGYVNM